MKWDDALGATDSRQSGISHALSPHAGTENLLGLLEPISVQVNTNVGPEDPATPQIGPAHP
jgi:hypothetical protein